MRNSEFGIHSAPTAFPKYKLHYELRITNYEFKKGCCNIHCNSPYAQVYLSRAFWSTFTLASSTHLVSAACQTSSSLVVFT